MLLTHFLLIITSQFNPKVTNNSHLNIKDHSIVQTHYKGDKSSVCVLGKQQRIGLVHNSTLFKKIQHYPKFAPLPPFIHMSSSSIGLFQACNVKLAKGKDMMKGVLALCYPQLEQPLLLNSQPSLGHSQLSWVVTLMSSLF